MTPEEHLAEIQEQTAQDWAIVRQMPLYQRLIKAPLEREAAAMEALTTETDPQVTAYLREEVRKARDIIEWAASMEQVYEYFHTDFEPESFD